MIIYLRQPNGRKGPPRWYVSRWSRPGRFKDTGMHVMRSAVQKNLAASHRASRGSHFSSKQRAQLQFSMMKTSHSNSLWALTVLFTSALLVAQTQALYFFLENGVAKCFYEELPKDTLVVGESAHYDRSSPEP